jgi:hypothetical protein
VQPGRSPHARARSVVRLARRTRFARVAAGASASSANARLTASSNCESSTGFTRKSTAPSRIASAVDCTSACPLRNRIGIDLPACTRCSCACRPFKCGIRRSSTAHDGPSWTGRRRNANADAKVSTPRGGLEQELQRAPNLRIVVDDEDTRLLRHVDAVLQNPGLAAVLQSCLRS